MELYQTCETYAKNRRFYFNAFLSLFFGGFLGAHHFYLRRVKSGMGMIALAIVIYFLSRFPLTDLTLTLFWTVLALPFLWMFIDMILMIKRIDLYNKHLFEQIRSSKADFKPCKLIVKVLYYLSLLITIPQLFFMFGQGFIVGFAQGILESAQNSSYNKTETIKQSSMIPKILYPEKQQTCKVGTQQDEWKFVKSYNRS